MAHSTAYYHPKSMSVNPLSSFKLHTLIMLIKMKTWGSWMAQLVKQMTLDFSSGHDLLVQEFEPRVRLHANSVEPAWDSPSLSLSPATLPLSKDK